MRDWPVHQPECLDAPIPGRRWYESCDPDWPRVGPDGRCQECGGEACRVCGREGCPDHAPFVILCDCGEGFTAPIDGGLVECPSPGCERTYRVASLVQGVDPEAFKTDTASVHTDERSSMATVTASVRINHIGASEDVLNVLDEALVNALAALRANGNVRVVTVQDDETGARVTRQTDRDVVFMNSDDFGAPEF